MARVFLTHTPDMLAKYYGRRALSALEEIAEVQTNPSEQPLDADALVKHVAGCDFVVSDRQTPGPAAVFERAPDLAAFLRCAVDIRNIDVEAASRAAVLVTRATPGFGAAVAELGLGMMIDLARGISSSVLAYRSGQAPDPGMGRQLQGATMGVIGYGEIGRRLAGFGHALGMTVLVNDPYKTIDAEGIEKQHLHDLLARSDFVVCLAVATPETENLMDASAFRRMRSDGFFINLSRGNLVDEAALAAALDVARAADQMPSPGLARRPDVVATPHLAGLTPAAVEHQAFDTVEQVRALVAGSLPANAVNGDSASRLSRYKPAKG